MTWYFDPNNTGGVNGGAEVIYALKVLLQAHGGVVQCSGNGAGEYSAVGDVIDDAAELNTAQAWFVILWRGVYFYFQRGGLDYNWWLRVSYTAPSGGGFILMATAADIQDWHGTTDAGAAIFQAPSSYRYHIGCDDAPGGFYAFTLINGTGASAGGIVFDPFAAASYPVEDTAPVVFYVGMTTTFGEHTYISANDEGYSPKCWYCRGFGLPDELASPNALVLTPGGYPALSSGHAFPRQLGSNPYTGEDDRFPVMYARPAPLATQLGHRGYGTVMRWAGAARSNGDTMRTGVVIDRVQILSIVLPFPDEACAL